jgi:hypothetical protein
MSLNVSINVGFLVQTHNMGSSTVPTLISNGIYQSGAISVTIYPRWYKHVSVEWTVPSNWGNCVFNVYTSQTEGGPWELINPIPITGTFLTEAVSKEYSKFSKGFYVVEALLLDKNLHKVRSASSTWNTYQSNWVALRSNEIQRRQYILLAQFTGVKSYLFRRRDYGKRCTNCWDPKTEKVIKDHCTVCFGTSFEGGYFDAVPFYVQYEPTPNTDQQVYYGTMENNQIGGRSISIPEVRLNDIIIRAGDWNAYLVDRMTNTELMSNSVSQIMVLTQLGKDSVEYNLMTKNLPDFPQQYI